MLIHQHTLFHYNAKNGCSYSSLENLYELIHMLSLFNENVFSVITCKIKRAYKDVVQKFMF